MKWTEPFYGVQHLNYGDHRPGYEPYHISIADYNTFTELTMANRHSFTPIRKKNFLKRDHESSVLAAMAEGEKLAKEFGV